MKNAIFSAMSMLLMILTGCSTSKQLVIPLSRSVELDDAYTII